jgi:hypothetical protein
VSSTPSQLYFLSTQCIAVVSDQERDWDRYVVVRINLIRDSDITVCYYYFYRVWVGGLVVILMISLLMVYFHTLYF